MTISIEDQQNKVNPLDEKNTIQRCPHDSEHPYAIISRNLIRDESISPNCRWLIMYLLSMKDGWKISITQVINHLSPHMGRDSVHKIFKEGIKAGYILRQEIKVPMLNSSGKRMGGAAKSYKYYVSENPKFLGDDTPKLKKCFRYTENQDTGSENRYTEFQYTGRADVKKEQVIQEEHSLKNHSSLDKRISKKQEYSPLPPKKEKQEPDKSGMPSCDGGEEISKSSKSQKIKRDFSPEVQEVASKMISILRKHNPVYRPAADLSKFLSQVTLMLEKDQQDVCTLLRVFEWASSDSEQRGEFKGWQAVLYSKNPAETFRKHFAKLYAQMRAAPQRKFAPSSDQEAALKQMEEFMARAI